MGKRVADMTEEEREKVRAQARARHAANADRVRAQQRARRAANRERVRTQMRAWRAANTNRVRAQRRVWRAADHPDSDRRVHEGRGEENQDQQER